MWKFWGGKKVMSEVESGLGITRGWQRKSNGELMTTKAVTREEQVTHGIEK